MSSIARFFLVGNEKRHPLDTVIKQASECRSLIRRMFSGRSYDPFDYLSGTSDKSLAFPLSGFVLVTYLYELLEPQQELQRMLKRCAAGDREEFLIFSTEDSRTFRDYLKDNPPNAQSLARFSKEEGTDSFEDRKYLMEAHGILLDWFGHVGPSHFGVIHIC
jgi:hypothetical protein